MDLARLLTPVLVVAVLGGCQMARMTLAQEMAWDQWKQCDHFAGVQLKEIRQDGQIWVTYTGDYGAWQDCIRKAREGQAQRGVAAAPAATAASIQGSAAVAPVVAPVWKVGDEW